MNDAKEATTAKPTVLPPEQTELDMAAWVNPTQCGKCNSRVDTFLRMTASCEKYTEANCWDCGIEWVINHPDN